MSDETVRRAVRATGTNWKRATAKAPWLNPIEPKWVHGKRAVAEPDGELPAELLKARICDYYGCELLPPLAQKDA